MKVVAMGSQAASCRQKSQWGKLQFEAKTLVASAAKGYAQHPSTHAGPDKQAMTASGPLPTVQTAAVHGQSTMHGNIYLIYVHFPGNRKTVSKLEESKWINLNFCILNHSIWLLPTQFISLSFSENSSWLIWGLLLVGSKGSGRHS